MEIWKNVNGSPQFEVSNLGRVRHIKFRRIRKLRNNNGYMTITLRTKGVLYSYLVHRLVAEHFLDDYSADKQVDHINRVRGDNRAVNLRMVTMKENHINKIKNVGVVEHIIELYKQGYTPEDIYKSLHQ